MGNSKNWGEMCVVVQEQPKSNPTPDLYTDEDVGVGELAAAARDILADEGHRHQLDGREGAVGGGLLAALDVIGFFG